MNQNQAVILDGKALSRKINNHLREKIADLQPKIGRPPGLAVLMVGDNPASAVYVRNKEKACNRIGMASFGKHLPGNISQEALATEIAALNQDNNVDGILIQLPLPQHLDAITLLHQIHPDKDADGLHPLNLGKLVRSEPGLRSCTPAGVIKLLEAYNIALEGKKAVVLGRSILVGKPLGLMLLEKNATVTMAHSKTQNLSQVCQEADILVAAVGKPELVTASMVKPGAVVIDVGINRIIDPEGNSHLVGDVEFESVSKVASYITPVPGGVGPMTVAMLLNNTYWSYSQKLNL